MGGIQPQPTQQQPYDVSADYVDSTTAYEPKQTGSFLDQDFISHGTYFWVKIPFMTFWVRLLNGILDVLGVGVFVFVHMCIHYLAKDLS